MPDTAYFLMLLAGVVASVALVTDLRSRRIPNWLTLTGLLLGLTLNPLLGMLSDGPQRSLQNELNALAGAVLGFCVLVPFYLLRVAGVGHAVGAGDVKLLAALGAILGPQALITVAIYALITGGIQSVFILAKTNRLTLFMHQTLIMRTAPTIGAAKAPYAVAIAAGVFLSMVLPPVVRF
jgi:prepilin peptidase CpaA